MSIKSTILPLFFLFCITACEKEKCDVPSYPVQFQINLLEYPYATKFPHDAGLQTVAITLFSQQMLRLEFADEVMYLTRKESDYVGYAGMVVWSDMGNKYHAADLCCPHCLDPLSPIQVDGAFATCPICGESYNLMDGYALPTKGITKQRLRTFSVRYQYPILSIHN